MSLFQEQNKNFQDFLSTVEKSMETLIEITQLLFSKIIFGEQLKLNAAITEYLHSLERLATGLLDPALITHDHLDKVLQDIEVHIQEAFPHLSLLKKTKSFYYTSRSCIPMRMKIN